MDVSYVARDPRFIPLHSLVLDAVKDSFPSNEPGLPQVSGMINLLALTSEELEAWANANGHQKHKLLSHYIKTLQNYERAAEEALEETYGPDLYGSYIGTLTAYLEELNTYRQTHSPQRAASIRPGEPTDSKGATARAGGDRNDLRHPPVSTFKRPTHQRRRPAGPPIFKPLEGCEFPSFETLFGRITAKIIQRNFEPPPVPPLSTAHKIIYITSGVIFVALLSIGILSLSGVLPGMGGALVPTLAFTSASLLLALALILHKCRPNQEIT